MIRRKLFTALTFALLCAGTSFSANSNVGTSGAQFLKIGAGARPTAMGDAFVGVADDVNAIYFNPAGLGFQTQSQMTAMRTEWFEGLNYDYGAFSLPLKSGSLGFSVSTLKAEDLEKRSADESLQGSFETLDAAYTFSYGHKMGESWSLGATARYLKQEIDATSAGAWGGDVGIFKKLSGRPVTVGLAIRHMGQEIKFVNESDPQPMTIDAGLGMKMLSNKLIVGLNFQKPRDNDVQFGTGLEYTQPLRKDFRCAVRTGYSSAKTDSGGSGLSIGGGVGYKLLDLDLAWVPYGDLGNTIRTGISFRF